MLARIALSLALLLLGAPLTGFAAGLVARTQVAKEMCINPKPAPDDIVLPMPCDLQMVFKPVESPAKDMFWDIEFKLGCDNCDRQGLEFYDRRFQGFISGPFTPADLPTTWLPALPSSDKNLYRYYFMGKYEVSGLQWRAVMDGVCPSGELTESDAQPQTDISWFDGVEFSRRYTEWLIKNAPEHLPHFVNDTKNLGYLRLPTEEEWEYAARGGNRVPTEALQQEDFFPLEPNTSMEEYAAFRPESAVKILEAPKRIGALRANPLGLYDTAGNVAEMNLETFQFSLAGRLHGAAGGFLRKGGSFVSSEGEIKPGRREEIPFFSARGATTSRDMGLRLVLSGIDIPDGGRLQSLKQEWQKMGESNSVVITGKNPLPELDKLLESTKDPIMQQNLTRLRSIIKDNQTQLERKESENLEALIRTTAYIIEALRSYAVRNAMVINMKKELSDEMADLKAKGQQSSKLYKSKEMGIEEYEKIRITFIEAIVAILNFYKLKLDDIILHSEKVCISNLTIVRSEYKKNQRGFMENMAKNLDVLEKHMAFVRKNGQGRLTKGKILDDVLVPALRVEISIK
jgi:hypothetical protein